MQKGEISMKDFQASLAAGEGILYLSETGDPYQLTVGNFRATAPDPRAPTDDDAQIFYALVYEYSWYSVPPPNSGLQGYGYSKWQAKLAEIIWKGAMLQKMSWWNPNATKEVVGEERFELLRRHEQGHFAIAEIWARKMYYEKRPEFLNLVGEGDTEALAQADLDKRVKDLEAKYDAECIKDQLEYDSDTEKGKNENAQDIRDAFITKDLATHGPTPNHYPNH